MLQSLDLETPQLIGLFEEEIMIVELTSGHLPKLRELYNDGVAHVPHCYPVDLERFDEAFAPVFEGKESPRRLSNERVFVAMEKGEPAGFVHVADYCKEEEPVQGAIRFLLYRPGERATGQSLLDRAMECFPDRDRVLAFHQNFRYDFYHRRYCYLTDRLGHIQALFQCNGFSKAGGEVCMDWDDFEVEPCEAPVAVEVVSTTKEDGAPRLSMKNAAVLSGVEIAACRIGSCGRWSQAEEIQDRFLVDSLSVEEPYQGQGLGRWLLLKTMQDAKELGYKHAAISNAVANYRAFMFYTNYGFHVTDWTYGWEKR